MKIFFITPSLLYSTTPSPFSGWQLLFVSFAVVIILLEIAHGWRLGLLRQLVRVVAIVAAYACAFFAARATLPIMRSLLKFPDPILALIGGAILATLVFIAINLIGAFLFKKTAQHSSRTVRLVWGSTGALLGILPGAITVWLTFAGIRLVGSIAEAKVRAQNLNAATALTENRPLLPSARRASFSEPEPLLSVLAQMKSSLENGTIGAAVKTADPIPPTLYRALEKAGEVASNVESAEKFLSFSGAREISENPKVIALRNDPQAMDAIAHGRMLELLRNPRVIDAMNDPAVQAKVKTFELERALDYALKK